FKYLSRVDFNGGLPPVIAIIIRWFLDPKGKVFRHIFFPIANRKFNFYILDFYFLISEFFNFHNLIFKNERLLIYWAIAVLGCHWDVDVPKGGLIRNQK